MFWSFLRRVTCVFAVRPLRNLWQPHASQIGSLDCLRSAAVLMVILYHLREAYLHFGGEASWLTRLPPIKYGIFGVDLFFVLSGYLIGKQLWRELFAEGTISLPRFLLRRGLRIWPLYYSFVVLMMFCAVPSYYRHTDAAWWSDFFCLSNYTNRGIVDGSWSLCTEEQFYLLLPLLLLAVWCLPTLRMRAWWLWGLLALVPVIRLGEWWCLTGDLAPHNDFFVERMSFPIHVRCDGLVAGVLIARYEQRGPSSLTPRWIASPWLVLLALLAGGGLCWWQRWIFCFAAASWIFAAIAANLIARPWLLAQFFQSRVFFWLSRLSFGMYLNHMYLFAPLARWSLANVPGAASYPLFHFVVASAALVSLSALVAVATYCLVEHPFLALRDAWLKQSPQPQVTRVGAAAPGLNEPAQLV